MNLKQYELKAGDKGSKVLVLKDLLYSIAEVQRAVPTTVRSEKQPYRSDKFDDTAASAVSFFQRWKGLPVTGVVDANTWAALGKQVSDHQLLHHTRNDPGLGRVMNAGTTRVVRAPWPTATHEAIIDEAFPGLTDVQRHKIKKGSEMIDLYVIYPATLNPANAHQHAMRKKDQTVPAAIKESQDWVDAKGEEAKRLQRDSEQQGRKGLAETALIAFGNGCHTIMDSTSPTHRGWQEYRLPDNKLAKDAPKQGIAGRAVNYIGRVWANGTQYACEMLEHTAGESRPPTKEEMKETVDMLRNYFRNVFGNNFYNLAVNRR